MRRSVYRTIEVDRLYFSCIAFQLICFIAFQRLEWPDYYDPALLQSSGRNAHCDRDVHIEPSAPWLASKHSSDGPFCRVVVGNETVQLNVVAAVARLATNRQAFLAYSFAHFRMYLLASSSGCTRHALVINHPSVAVGLTCGFT
jgi:hypothetical protein